MPGSKVFLAAASVILGLSANPAGAADLTIGSSLVVTSIDPHFHNASLNNAMAKHFFDPLVAVDDNQQIVPGLAEAWRAVDSGEFALALLVQPVHAPQVVEVAAAGELLPQKSTFFYPKMSTGMVLNPLD